MVIVKQELALKGTIELRLGLKSTIDSPGSEAEPATINEQEPQVAVYADILTYAVGAPVRPWHLHRLYSRPARGLPERHYQKKSDNRSLTPDINQSNQVRKFKSKL